MSLEEKGSSDVIHVENPEDTKSLEYDQEFERKTMYAAILVLPH